MPDHYAAIDIGSNAVRLLFTSVFRNQNGTIVSEKATLVRIPVRLGLDVFGEGSVSPLRKQMLLKTMEAFKLLIEVYSPLGYRACATAAMREASNSSEVIDAIREQTGLVVEVITGQQEAELISSCNGFLQENGFDWHLYIDVGGGSTELSLYKHREFVDSASFNIGTIRLLQEGVDEGMWIEMKRWIKDVLPLKEKMFCVGSGGNINKLVKLFGNTSRRTITRKALKGAHTKLSEMTLADRVQYYGMRYDRADVIVPAAEIFLRTMKWGRITEVHAPRFGLADGLAISQYLRDRGEMLSGHHNTGC